VLLSVVPAIAYVEAAHKGLRLIDYYELAMMRPERRKPSAGVAENPNVIAILQLRFGVLGSVCEEHRLMVQYDTDDDASLGSLMDQLLKRHFLGLSLEQELGR
jgi:hypothetical protein